MGTKDVFSNYKDVFPDQEQQSIKESMDSDQELSGYVNLSTNLKNGNCIIIGEKSKRKKLCEATCVNLEREAEYIYLTRVDEKFKWYSARYSIKKWCGYDKHHNFYFIIEDCNNNIEEVRKLLGEIKSQSQNLANARFLFTLQGSEATKKLFPKDWYVVDVQASTQVRENILEEITPETLREAEKNAQELLQELEERKASYGVSSDEYLEYCNAEAFIAHLPEWKHLYMKEYGAFPRLEKENQILGDIQKNIQKFSRKKNGLLLHVISGDSGCGKSALVKLVLRRLIDKQKMEEFHYLSEILPRIRIFKLGKEKNWEVLEKAVSVKFPQAIKGNEFIYVVYFDDDLFDLEKEEIDKLLGIFKKASDNLKIYFLTTSPSWIFSPRDLYEYNRKLGLVASKNTIIGSLDHEDRKALKGQYQAMYGRACRTDLLELIESEKETLILLKLALHQNLTYSEYLTSVFHRLEAKQPKYLAALLLSSTLARFYVHFPITLIQKLNQDLPLKDHLPENRSFYADFNDEQGLRLFRIRTGTRNEMDSEGLPDTIAPFHNRVAQVIYDTWPKDKDVPVFECKLWELKNKVYLKLNESPHTRPILANVFRGHLHVASDSELLFFIDNFGPVQYNKWVLLDDPDTAYRWITYSKYRIDRTKDFRKYWSRKLNQMIQYMPKDPSVHLVFFLLDPHKIIKGQEWISAISGLEEKYFSMLYEVLDELLSQYPLPIELFTSYLLQMKDWLNKYPPIGSWVLSYKYKIITSLIRIKISKLWLQKKLNHVMVQIIKDYLCNITNEYATNEVLGIFGLKTLVKKIEWDEQDSIEISESLQKYLHDEGKRYRPILFELLLIFIRFGNLRTPSGDELFFLYSSICVQDSDFCGLTYTSQDFWLHLKCLNRKYPAEYRQLLGNIVVSLSSGRLAYFMKSAAYPDFLEGFIGDLKFHHYKVIASDLLNLLRPLVANFNDPQPAKYIFWNTKKLFCPDIKSFFDRVEGDIDRQIRLCLAEKIDLSLELILKDFTELLEKEKLLFSLGLDFQSDLGNNILVDLEKEFKNNGISLSRNATILIKKRDSEWLIVDKNNKQSYTFRKEESNLNIYKSAITIPSALSVLLIDYLKIKKKEEFLDLPLKGYQKRIYAWLHNNLDRNEAILFFPLICVDVMFSSEEAKGFEKLAILNIQNNIPYEYFPFSYFNWWLKEEVNLTHSEQKYVLFDVFWDYLLRNSNLEIDNKFVIYERYFLYLLDKYEISQDEIWWGKAVNKLITYYNKSIVRSLQSKTQQIKWKRKICDKVVMLYKQRKCLDQMMETILKSYYLVKSRLKGDFKKVVEESLTPYKDKLWAAKWQLKLEPETKIDGTKLFLDYLNFVEDQPIDVFDVRNQADWWFEWMKSSKQNSVNELNKVWQWLDKTRPPNVSIFLLPRLFEFFIKNRIKFRSGLLAKNVIERVDANFRDKSILIQSYTEYLKIFDGRDQDELLNKEIKELREMLSWFLNEVKDKTDTLTAVYGLQNLFVATLKYKLDFELVKMEEVFFGVLEAYIDHDEGGGISKHYFPWLLCQKEQMSIVKYLGWIKTSYQKRQTPYIFKHLIDSLLEENFQVSTEELDMIWDIFKLLISKRLESEGTTGGAPSFFEYFIVQIPSKDKNRLNKISEEFYSLCLKMSDNSRVIYLLISMLPFWKQLSDKPLPEEMVTIWQKMLSTCYKKVEPLGKLTRQISNYLQNRKEEELITKFHSELLNFIKSNLCHVLSPSFAKILIKARFYQRELSILLPELIENQKIMENLFYAIGEYFRYPMELINNEELIRIESSIIKTIEKNLYKSFSEKCLSLVINKCSPGVHYEQITQLIETYLEIERESEDFYQVLCAYHAYEGKSNIEDKSRKDTIEKFFSVIRANAQRVQAARYFSAILETWKAAFIPQELALDTLRHLILQIDPRRWRRVLKMCVNFSKFFGHDILLYSKVPIGEILNKLERDKELALMSIKQQLNNLADKEIK